MTRNEQRAAISLAVAAAILWIPMFGLVTGRPPGFLRDLGFLSGPPGTPLAWVLGLVVGVGYAAFAVRNIPVVRQHWCAVSWFKLLAIIAAVAAATVEEAFFRRLIMDPLMRAGWSAVAQVIASGLAFGAAHGIWGVVTGHGMIGLRIMMATGTLGLALAFIYLVGERSLTPVIVSHFLVTATIQPGILIAAFSGQMRNPPTSTGPATSEQ